MAGGLDFEVEMPALPPFVARLRTSQAVISRELTTAMRRIVVLGQNESRRLSPVDTGRLRNSIAGKVSDAGGGVRGVWGTNVTYAIVQEEGRRAGAAMPPQGALLGWMGRHGIPASAEFVVRRAIGRHGTKAHHFIRDAFEKIKPIAVRELNAALGRALDKIAGSK